jgi:hypothetical protein
VAVHPIWFRISALPGFFRHLPNLRLEWRRREAGSIAFAFFVPFVDRACFSRCPPWFKSVLTAGPFAKARRTKKVRTASEPILRCGHSMRVEGERRDAMNRTEQTMERSLRSHFDAVESKLDEATGSVEDMAEFAQLSVRAKLAAWGASTELSFRHKLAEMGLQAVK